MKSKKLILSTVVAFVAGINVYLANDIQTQKNNSLSLLNLENIAEAGDGDDYGDVNTGHGNGYTWSQDGNLIVVVQSVNGRIVWKGICKGVTNPCSFEHASVSIPSGLGPKTTYNY